MNIGEMTKSFEEALEEERSGELYAKAVEGISAVLEMLGQGHKHEVMTRTPHRTVGALLEICSTSFLDCPPSVTLFDAEGNIGNMVVVKNIPFTSLCEHHLLPFLGTAAVAYIPNSKILGLSKIPRLVEYYAKQPQVQERLTSQICDSIYNIDVEGVGVRLEARHMCMELRGVECVGASTQTTALRGSFMDDHRVRSEFLNAVS